MRLYANIKRFYFFGYIMEYFISLNVVQTEKVMSSYPIIRPNFTMTTTPQEYSFYACLLISLQTSII